MKAMLSMLLLVYFGHILPLRSQFAISNYNGAIWITGYSGSDTNLIIPETIDGMPVVAIESDALNNLPITSLALPASVTNIHNQEFDANYELAAISVDPNNMVFSSVNGVLFNKNQETLVRCPEGYVGSDGAYTVPNGVSKIGDNAFHGCLRLRSIDLVSGVLTIGTDAFNGSVGITNLTLADSVTSLGAGVFDNCWSLKSIYIPANVTNIGFVVSDGPFFHDYSLLSISVDQKNTSYSSVDGVLFSKNGTLLFAYPGGKKGHYIVPNGVTSVNSLCGSSNLTAITITDGVTNIDDYAALHCVALTNIDIGKGMASIGTHAFMVCSSLQSINVDAGNPNYSSLDGVVFNKSRSTLVVFPGNKGVNYEIPAGVSRIEDYAFEFATKLVTVTVPASVSYIGSEAFEYCTSLEGAYFMGDAPSIGNGPFDSGIAYYLPGTVGWGKGLGLLSPAVWHLPYPLILASGPSFGFETNQFGFVVSWATSLSIVVDGATNVLNPLWQPLQTNNLTGGFFKFIDFGWTNYQARFYRVRSL